MSDIPPLGENPSEEVTGQHQPLSQPHDQQGLGRLPGLASLAASSSRHAGSWAAKQSLHASKRVAQAMTSREQASALADDVASGAREVLETVIAMTDLQRGAGEANDGHDGPLSGAGAATGGAQKTSQDDSAKAEPSGEAALRREADELLRRSRQLDEEPTTHPAYERILSQLTPDEARILRLMLLDGPQPAVDVRGGGIFGYVNARTIKRCLTMIGPHAGLRRSDQVPAYLNNLLRLGLIWLSPETIRDYQRYQVLEAQPQVSGAVHSARMARVVRSSIHLTPFGEDFCRTCMGGESYGRVDLPAHSSPAPHDAAAGEDAATALEPPPLS